jgi:hypothetical protein
MFTMIAQKNGRIIKQKLHKFRPMKSKRRFLNSIPLLIGFLLLTQIAKGQIFYGTTPNFGKTISIPVTLMDTIIHDLQERKILIKKDSLSKAYISILTDESYAKQTKIWEGEKSLLKSEKKRTRNGWQRNFFILSTILLGFICIR